MAVEIQHGDEILPSSEEWDMRLELQEQSLVATFIGASGREVKLEFYNAVTFRFTEYELVVNDLDLPHNTLQVLNAPRWPIQFWLEDSPYGTYIRKLKSFYLDVPDIGLLECLAELATRHDTRPDVRST